MFLRKRRPTISEIASLANRRASWVNVSPRIRTIKAMIAVDAADGINRLLRYLAPPVTYNESAPPLADVRAPTATTDVSPRIPSSNIPPPPTKCASASLSNCLEESDDPIRPCQPEHAPQAIVTKRRGHNGNEMVLISPDPAPMATGANQLVKRG